MPSNRKNKRFVAFFSDGRRIHFGFKGGQTYIDHGDKIKRENYIKRHQKNEDWTKVNAGSLSRFLLWGNTTDLKKNHQEYMNIFKTN